MNSKVYAFVMLICVLALLAGCGPAKPVLYPTGYYNQVGKAQAEADIQDCFRLARESGVSPNQGKTIARETATGAGVGAVVGGAIGSLSGDFGKGAAIGAIGGAGGGLTRGVYNSRNPSPVYRNFVDRCLREKGYEPVGWQ